MGTGLILFTNNSSSVGIFSMLRPFKRITLISILLLTACSGSIRITNISSVNNESDWKQLGGSPTHSKNAINEIAPPLKMLWKSDISHSPLGILTASDGTIFVSTMGGRIYALDHETGVSMGSLDLEKSIGKGMAIDGIHGYFGRISNGKTLFSYELRNGIYVWKRNIGPVESIPLISGGLLYVTTKTGYVYCLDMETGAEKWKFDSGKPFHSSPAGWNGLIIATNDSGYVYGISASNGKMKWKLQTGAPIFATPIISGDDIFVGNISGTFYSIDAESGTTNWKHEGTGSYYSTASAGDDNVYIMGADGMMLSLSKPDGSVIWKSDLNAPISEGILLSGKYIYIGSMDKNLYAVSAETGVILWSEKLEGRVRTSPLEYKGSLYVGTENKYLYAFGMDSDTYE